MVDLLDVNLLVALTWQNHEHHEAAHHWFALKARRQWASCPITQLGYLRVTGQASVVGVPLTLQERVSQLGTVLAHPGHQFVPADMPALSEEFPGRYLIQGHRQLTDAYLLHLAKKHQMKLVTLDGGVATLLPTAERRRWCEIVSTR